MQFLLRLIVLDARYEKISRVDSGIFPEAALYGLPVPSKRGFIHDIVVDQRSEMRDLYHGSQKSQTASALLKVRALQRT